MNENRIKLIKLFGVALTGVTLKGAMGDDEIEEMMKTKISDFATKITEEEVGITMDSTVGDLVDTLLEIFDEDEDSEEVEA